MKLHFEIDLNTDSREQIAMVANLLNNVTNASRRPTATQPQVVENSGSDGQGLDLSPGDTAVVAASIPGAEPEPKEAATPVKDAVKRTRRTKAEMEADAAPAPAPEVAEAPKPEPVAAPVETAPSASAEATLDDVRAALQAFTAAKGVPAGIELLKEFGAARISELKAENFAAFIGKCNV